MATTAVSNASSSQAIYDALNVKQATATSTSSETQSKFLTLLTAQLKNQDPLNPLDNAQMTSQLAQISTLDGIERLNTTLQALLDSSSGSQTLQAATMVGRSVLVPASTMSLVKSMGLGGVELSGSADSATVTIKDANGLAVRTLNLGALDAGVHGFSWDGKTDSGVQAADGSYSFTVTAKQGQNDVAATALALGTVSGVSRSGQTFSLDVSGLGKFGMSDVKEIL
ncbi:MAG TPA: flagellar hook assembly protein FlgD [Rhodocyclaceae bacterium]|nr:flagellar hook assembly protein FlgD [Rhodocyclaceae bacterium]